MHRDLASKNYIWNHEIYWEWYKYIKNDISNKVIQIEAEIEIEIRSWDTQWAEGLIAPNKELEIDK